MDYSFNYRRIDDVAVGGTPDDTVPHTLSLTNVNEAPTVALTNVVPSLAEDADTSSAIKIADIVVTDDALGTNNLTLSGAPVDKALVLIETNQGTKGKNLKGGYCLRTDSVRDAAHPDSALTYALVSYCTFEAAPAFSFPTAARGSRKNAALAVVNRVTSPDKAGNAADLHVEDMQILQPDELDPARTMLKRMLDLEACTATDADAGKAEAASPAFKQRKCRRLSAYPTCEDI